jgi:hypothetical protein
MRPQLLPVSAVQVGLGAVLLILAQGCGSVEPSGAPDAADPDAALGDAGAIDAVDVDAPDAPACTVTTCENNTLTVCTDSMVERVEQCRLGCASSDRCNLVDPSNGLRPQLETALTQADVTLPAGTIINTDTGTIQANNQAIAAATATVNQPGGPVLRVFLARSWTINDVRVEGSLPLALVAAGDVRLEGLIDASANGNIPGAGAQACGNAGTGRSQTGGFWSRPRAGHPNAGEYIWSTDGSGGGGFGSAGAAGGDATTDNAATPGAGGVVNGTPALVPLRGGCAGGGQTNTNVANGYGGAGGGAVQIVSGSGEIVVAPPPAGVAGVHVGGGGGRGSDNGGANGSTQSGSGGGGSGGGVLLEAASIRFDGSAMLLAAGGGGGGSGGCGAPRNGQDAPPSAGTPAGGICPAESWGQPASGGAGAAAAAAAPGISVNYHAAGSGGGGHGRIRLNTATGTYEGTPVIRGDISTGTVQAR